MPRRAFKIPTTALFMTVTCLLAGELYCGTEIYFACMMALTVCAAGITYNILGGLGTFRGIVFALLALRSVVISQFAKVMLHQPADSYMSSPALTATVYASFFGAILIGAFAFQHFRFALPHPSEPETKFQSETLYAICLLLGITGVILFNIVSVTYGNGAAHTEFDSKRSIGVALSPLLQFALVIAVDRRIRETDGRHSFGLDALIPALMSIASGMINSVRGDILAPVLIYLATCYFRGFRFRGKHLAGAVIGIVFFVFVISPLELYTRSFIANQALGNRVITATRVISNGDFRQISAAVNSVDTADRFEDYYELPGTTVLSRLSRIRMDSNLIASCSNYHYGFEGVKVDLLGQIPHFLYKNKPEYGSADFLGRVSGVSAGIPWNTEPEFTMIGDAFGAFGFPGVIVLGIFVWPFVLTVLDSIFETSRPWGTLALITAMINSQGPVGPLIATLLLRTPIYILGVSYLFKLVIMLRPTLRASSRNAGHIAQGEPNRDLGLFLAG